MATHPIQDSLVKKPDSKARLARQRLPELRDLLDPCRLCPRQCLAHRTQGEVGECGLTDELMISSVGLHHGNERVISGIRGSGNIFISGCSLHCVYCQNWEVSQLRDGRVFTPAALARSMLMLRRLGAHNINIVTPTHVTPMLLEALAAAWEAGLDLPIVYNTGGYDAVEALQLLDGLVDVFLPDMKYGDAETGRTHSTVLDYPSHNQAAVKEMYRQVGKLELNDEGVAVHGVLVRHLVLPENTGQLEKILDFLEREIGGPVHVNLMGQYRPCYQAGAHAPLDRRVRPAEVETALGQAKARSRIILVEVETAIAAPPASI